LAHGPLLLGEEVEREGRAAAREEAARLEVEQSRTSTGSLVDRMLVRGALIGGVPPLPRTGTVVAMAAPTLLPFYRPSSRTPTPTADGPCSPRPTMPSGPW